MKVLWLAPVHYDQGQDVHPAPWISTLAKSLREDHQVELTIVNYEPRLPESRLSFEKEGITYTFLKTPVPKLDHLGFFRKRVKILKDYITEHRGSYDMIHVHGSEHQYEAAVHDSGIPYVLSMQGVMGECLKRLQKKWDYTHLSWWMSSIYERHYVAKLNDFICRTHFDSGFVRSRNPKARIHENWEMIRAPFFQDLGTTEPTSLLYMGGTHPIKGVHLMLRAYDAIRAQVDIGLKILGKVEEEKVEQVIEEFGLKNFQADEIEYLGFQNVAGVVSAMNSSYALVHTSLIDNSPNSVCEAQVGGIPVVCTNVGGVSSLIEHGRTGMLSTLDPQNIAEKVLELIWNPTLHSTLKNESRQMARLRHDKDVISQRTMDIYRKVLRSSDPHNTDIQDS